MTQYSLKNAQRELDLASVKIMGILNVTPDSFSDGGKFRNLNSALIHAEAMIKAGVSIIDIGGESTRPGASEVSVIEELDRTIPIIEAIRQRFDIWISIDTSKPEVMNEAYKAGVDLINDVRALQMPGAREMAAKTGLPVCIMHRQGEPQSMQTNPQYTNVITEVADFLSAEIQLALDAGIKKSNLLIDPGFGFGKNHVHNYTLLKHLQYFKKFNLPILIGLSRKRMLQHALESIYINQDPSELNRVNVSIAGALLAAQNGANIVRVHDVRETVEAISVYNLMQQISTPLKGL